MALSFREKIRKKFLHLRLKPIRVFCFHQVSEEFDAETMWECDWIRTEVFKDIVWAMKKKYTFISLQEAYSHITDDKFRVKNYAVLTADDGWTSILNVLPWLAEQNIPLTLFLNPLYLDGLHYQERKTEKLLTREDVVSIINRYYPLITIASHGWSHKDCLKMSEDEFSSNVELAETALQEIKGKIPFFAFTFGRHTISQVAFLEKKSLIPVFIDGVANYSDVSRIHRELLDGKQV